MNADPAIDEVILDTELKHINFFNGRLLTGGDLEAEQSAQHTHFRLVGTAVGDGVAVGLEVTPATSSPPGEQVVLVAAGLAVNRAGQTLRLECDQRVALLRPPDPANRDACVFADCSAPISSGTLARGAGLYLLTIAPASQPEGKAPVSGLGSGNATCNSRYLTEGVKFRLLPLDVDPGSVDALTRNTVAYRFFGLTTQQSAAFLTDPKPGPVDARTGLADLVTAQQLTDYDVPLAVIQWLVGGSLGYIDLWSVRRRITRAPVTPWPFTVDEQVRSEGEARFLQFQEHIEALRSARTALPTLVASQVFRYLPPVGVLPLATTSQPNGIDRTKFFQGLTTRDPLYIEGSRLRHLCQLALDYPPIDLKAAPMMWLYIVRENAQANAAAPANGPQPILLFASGQLPYAAVPQFDVSVWNFSNYVLT